MEAAREENKESREPRVSGPSVFADPQGVLYKIGRHSPRSWGCGTLRCCLLLSSDPNSDFAQCYLVVTLLFASCFVPHFKLHPQAEQNGFPSFLSINTSPHGGPHNSCRHSTEHHHTNSPPRAKQKKSLPVPILLKTFTTSIHPSILFFHLQSLNHAWCSRGFGISALQMHEAQDPVLAPHFPN